MSHNLSEFTSFVCSAGLIVMDMNMNEQPTEPCDNALNSNPGQAQSQPGQQVPPAPAVAVQKRGFSRRKFMGKSIPLIAGLSGAGVVAASGFALDQWLQ